MMTPPECPCCGKILRVKNYYDDVRGTRTKVETSMSCKCGFNSTYSYGSHIVEYPEGYDQDGNKIEEECEL